MTGIGAGMTGIGAGMTGIGAGMTGIGYGMKGVDIGIVAEMTYSNTKGVIYTYFKLFKFPLKIR
ncbi:hypothetical protein [Wolbachia endosymbiont (group B) of Idaea biselata]